jgi:beta-1,4-N-acetylglucosaminyltransferase
MTQGGSNSDGMEIVPSKICFVTVGATAPFDGLVQAVLRSPFLESLHDASYTDLVVQYGQGKGKELFGDFLATRSSEVKQKLGIEVSGFDFKTDGLDQDMKRARGGGPGSSSNHGLIISHAGQHSRYWIHQRQASDID